MNADLRLQIVTRSGLRCECGCKRAAVRGEMDHFFGRAKAEETLATLWWLRVECHHEKTENKPSRAFWLLKFIAHCGRHDYPSSADRAQRDLEWSLTKKAFA